MTDYGREPDASSDAPVSPLLDEAVRPHASSAHAAPETSDGLASAQMLLQVHEHLRHELSQIRQVGEAVAQGQMPPSEARSVINQMTIRQNFWTFGSFCAQYCRVVTMHHTIEDRLMFPALRQEDETLAAVLARLSEEHEIIAAVIDRFDRALVSMMDSPSGVEPVRSVMDELSDALLSHLAYEERELVGPLARSNIRA